MVSAKQPSGGYLVDFETSQPQQKPGPDSIRRARKTAMIDVSAITDLHRDCTERWHHAPIDNPYRGFLNLVCEQHQRNFLLWHEEDKARDPTASDHEIAAVKRRIDRLNQERNDWIERLDEYILNNLAAWGVRPLPRAKLNTETPGAAIDRLSILALRIYHMEEQTQRTDVDEEHRERARAKLSILHQQHEDLSTALADLLADLFSGKRVMKIYRQFKMYNDPAYNPYLAQRRPAA
ncbi:MAG: DUF4254 domain-containing protein [Thermogutta sp.]